MGNQVVVILDNPLLDADPWADAVFAETGLTPVDNAAITKAMAQDAEAKQALLANISDPMGAQETLSPHYRRILQKLYADQPRLGIYGTAWLVHIDDVAACVVDWSEVMARAHAPGVTEWDREKSIKTAKDFLHARLQKHLSQPGRYKELEHGLSTNERVQRTVAFLRERGVTD